MRRTERLGHHLTRLKALRGQRLAAGLAAEGRVLSRWQSERLAQTHADLLHSARYRPAVEFFLTELYGPRDFDRRHRDLERISPMLVRVLPAHMIHTLTLALEMNVVTEELDAALLRVLVEEPDFSNHLDDEVYAEAYRRCDNHARRRRQLELIREVGEELEVVTTSPGVGTALGLAGTPARLMGLGELHGLLERGFRAFRHMRGAKQFLEAIVGRERQIMDRIFAGHARPFEPANPGSPGSGCGARLLGI
ncbi:MAG: hypothetical protein GY856_32210 [bacterium]|nr:hypothetical protein [bacterium]